MYDDILVPTDGSAGAEAAARHAMILGSAFESRIHLLSVVDESSYSSALADLDAMVGDQREQFVHRAQDAIAELEPLVDDRSLPCTTAVEHGIPHEVICAYAADHEVDLVAMGTHGRTGLDRVLLGSVTGRVVRTSDVPVLTARHEPDRSRYERILVPTDGSESATAAIAHAVAVADRFDATVHALLVVDIGSLAGVADVGSAIPGLLESLETDCERALETVETRCAEHDVDVVGTVGQGTPVRTIQAYVDDAGIDLVAMGTHGRTGLERYLLGSVTERMIRTSDVPILTVR